MRPAGWYPDPGGAPQLRWWDGACWTPHARPLAPATPPGMVQRMPVVQSPFASGGQRMVAYVLDGTLLFVVFLLVNNGLDARVKAELTGVLARWITTSQAPGSPAEWWAMGLLPLLLFHGMVRWVACSAHDLAWLWFKGQTLGQLAAGIRVVPADDLTSTRRLEWPVMVRRTLLRRALTSFIRPLFWIQGFKVMSGSEQDWCDRFAGTKVVRTR